RTHRHGGVVAEPQSAGCQPVDVRRIDLGAKCSEIGVAQVIQQYDNDIGRTGLRRNRRRPPGLRVGEGSSALSLEQLARISAAQGGDVLLVRQVRSIWLHTILPSVIAARTTRAAASPDRNAALIRPRAGALTSIQRVVIVRQYQNSRSA